MAFPATYNINYYKGDTLEFSIFPKLANGASFNLSDYDDSDFTISTQRGTAGIANQIQCAASIINGGTEVKCAIRPNDSLELQPGTTYVYDVQVTKTQSPYDMVYTLLTGTITVTDQVTGAV